MGSSQCNPGKPTFFPFTAAEPDDQDLGSSKKVSFLGPGRLSRLRVRL